MADEADVLKPVASENASWLKVASRLTRRTVDLLFIAFVLVVGLSVGGQLVDWWRADPFAPPPLPFVNGEELDWSRSPVTLKFGDAATSMERIPIHADRKQIEAELTRLGKAIVDSADVPKSPMLDGEREWLGTLRSTPPLMWDSPRGNVYRRLEPLPAFVATRFIELTNATEADKQDSEIQRIVGWGLAFPTSSSDWTIYVFHPDTASAAPDHVGRIVPLPRGAENVTHLTGTNGCQWRVFQGRGDVSGWVQHFDDYFDATSSTARSVESGSASLKYRRGQIMTEIQIRTEPDGRLTGVAWSANEGVAK